MCVAFTAVLSDSRWGQCARAWRRGPRRRCALRADLSLNLVGGRLPEDEPDLASQPKLSRLENAVDRKSCYRMAIALSSCCAAVPRATLHHRPSRTTRGHRPHSDVHRSIDRMKN